MNLIYVSRETDGCARIELICMFSGKESNQIEGRE